MRLRDGRGVGVVKKIKSSIVILLGVFLIAVTAIHWIQARDARAKLDQLRVLSGRQNLASNLIIDLERYRRSSASFRRLGDAESSSAKDKLRSEFNRKINLLNTLNATAEDQASAALVNDKISEFLLLSARIEPTLYSRDFYQRPEAREIHDHIVASLSSMIDRAKARETSLVDGKRGISFYSLRLIVLATVIVFGLAVALLAVDFLQWVKPSLRLKAFAEQCKNGLPTLPEHLKGVHSEIATVLRDLAATVHSQRMDRHRFIVAVSSELRPPLMALDSASEMIESSEAGSSEREQAREIVKRSVFRLSQAFDDLTDLLETEQRYLKLDEKIVDLRSTIQASARLMGGGAVVQEVRVHAPNYPIWAHVDPRRMERVLLHLVMKVLAYATNGNPVEVGVEASQGGPAKGVEIVIQESPLRKGTRGAVGAPEQDVLRHWVSENGYGMGLAKRIVQAHGGTLTVAGLSGSGIIFRIRLPGERIAAGHVAPLKTGSPLETFAFSY